MQQVMALIVVTKMIQLASSKQGSEAGHQLIQLIIITLYNILFVSTFQETQGECKMDGYYNKEICMKQKVVK